MRLLRQAPHPCPLCGCRGGSRTARRSRHPKRYPPPTNDNCPLRHRPASPYIGCMRHSRAERPSFPRRREPRTLPHADPLALWERVRVRVRGRECNEMQSNATELKVSPLLATPDEANQCHNQGRLAHRIRVNGVPNEATVASFSASPLGVNEAKQGQIGPGVNPPPVVPVPAPTRAMIGNERKLKVLQLLATPEQPYVPDGRFANRSPLAGRITIATGG